MRLRRLLALPLALFLTLAAASPAMALDVSVVDFAFAPENSTVAVGETVTWRFDAGGHTTTSVAGQRESWDSDLRSSDDTFSHTFSKPGRFVYVCTPHRSSMKGSVTVGTDAVGDTVDAFKSRRNGSRVTVSFRLNEPARVTYNLEGPSKKTVRKGRLRAGKHSFRVKGLDEGRYAGTLTAVDDFRKKATAKKSFRVR